MKKFLFLFLSMTLFAKTACAAPTLVRASSLKTKPTPAVLPQKDSLSASEVKQANTQEVTTTASSENATDRLSISKIYLNKTKPTTTPTTTNTTSAETEALRAQVEALQSQLSRLQNEIQRKADTGEITNLQNIVTNKIDALDNKFVTNASLDSEINNKLSQRESLTDEAISEKVRTILSNKQVLTVTDKNILENQIQQNRNEFAKYTTTAALAQKLSGDNNITDLDTAVRNKLDNIVKTNDMNDAISAAKNAAISEAASDAEDKISVLNTTITNKLNNYATKDSISADKLSATLDSNFVTRNSLDDRLRDYTKTTDMATAINTASNTAKNAAINAAKNDAEDKINALNTNITIITNKLNDYATKESVDTVSANLSSNFVTRGALEDKLVNYTNTTVTPAILSAKTDAINAADASANVKFVKNDDIDSKITNKLTGYAKTTDLSADNLANTLQNKFVKTDAIDSKIDTKLTGYAKTTDLVSAIADADTAATNKFLTRDNLGTAIADKNILSNYATKDSLSADSLATTLQSKFVKIDTIGDAIENKLANKNFLTGADKTALQSAISTAKEEAKAAAISDADSKLGQLNNSLTSLYAKKSDVTSEITTAKNAAITAANDKVTQLGTSLTSAINTAKSEAVTAATEAAAADAATKFVTSLSLNDTLTELATAPDFGNMQSRLRYKLNIDLSDEKPEPYNGENVEK